NGDPASFTVASGVEADAIRWVLENRQQAGAFTSTFPDCTCRYLCLFAGDYVFGAIGIDMNGKPFTEFENTILLSIVNACTMALENTRMAQEQRKAEIRAENERLRAGLLRSISHDLRTPLTSIYGNASNLRSHEMDLPREDRDKIYTDIMEDSGWLIAQFENILSMTKLESSRGENGNGLLMTVENIEDVIEESLRHIAEHPDHDIRFVPSENALFARMDPRLIMQVLINLLNNAVKYTPAGSVITVRAVSEQEYVCVEVADNGPGIPQEDKPHIFDLFYTGTKPLADSYRSLGLGLNLCAQILRAHGGSIEVADNIPSGAVFRFRLPEVAVSVPEDPEVYL
ncbi:MAG: ATP-binding protein, partial [Eubacteriales bacterium]|nr:ATP-binding protein [Eubacteriales bacterium]